MGPLFRETTIYQHNTFYSWSSRITGSCARGFGARGWIWGEPRLSELPNLNAPEPGTLKDRVVLKSDISVYNFSQ